MIVQNGTTWLNSSEISKTLNVPLTTIQEWIKKKVDFQKGVHYIEKNGRIYWNKDSLQTESIELNQINIPTEDEIRASMSKLISSDNKTVPYQEAIDKEEVKKQAIKNLKQQQSQIANWILPKSNNMLLLVGGAFIGAFLKQLFPEISDVILWLILFVSIMLIEKFKSASPSRYKELLYLLLGMWSGDRLYLLVLTPALDFV